MSPMEWTAAQATAPRRKWLPLPETAPDLGDVMAVVKCHPAGIGMTELRTELGMSKTWLQRRVRAAEDCGLVRVERKIFGARSVWTVLPLADGEE